MKTTTSEQILQTKYQIKLSKNKATFIWSSTPENPLKSSIDLKTKINPYELLLFAKEFNCPADDSRILVQNLEQYNRLLIYACVRALLKNAGSIRKLKEQILNMTSWDAHYWASAFRESWWKYGKHSELQRLIKAFILFFEIK